MIKTDIDVELRKACGGYNEMKIAELKKELASYDYIGVKIATGVATKKDYAEQIAYCEELRQQIRKLEN